MIEARFDDLGPTPWSLRMVDPVGVIEARTPGEVADALEAVEASTARGLWAAGFVGYEAAPGFDTALEVRRRGENDPFGDLPLLWFALFDRADPSDLPEPPADDPDPAEAIGHTWLPSIDRTRYDASVDAIRGAIAAGETYQVNYTLRMRASIAGDPRGLYRDLCLAQRGAYGAYLDLGRYKVASASPELFLRVEPGGGTGGSDRIVTRPMKGTIGRGRWPAEDAEAAAHLRGSEKDRAENAMIVDLLRNDLGRIALPGSVHVRELFATERYETVWQMTSTVEAELRAGTSIVEVFRALFPSGSVTGAPKIATMRLIAAIEDAPRGVYCGAVGLLTPPGEPMPRARFNVAIRTVVVDGQTGLAEYGVGGGITYDSRADAEYEEVLAKARVLTVRRPPFELLETMRCDPDVGIADLDRHLARLTSSADYFGFSYDEGRVRAAIDEAVRGVTIAARVRLRLARDGTVRVATDGLPDAGVVRVAIDDVPVDPGDATLFHKVSRRARYEQAAARHPEADDVLLVNHRGEVTESTIANVAARLGDRWYTPPLSSGCLPGTRRAALVEEGTLLERPISVEELRGADAVALVSATRGWREAILLD